MEPSSWKFKVRSVCGTGEGSDQELSVWVGGIKVTGKPSSADGVRRQGERTPGQDSGGLRCAHTRQKRSRQRQQQLQSESSGEKEAGERKGSALRAFRR